MLLQPLFGALSDRIGAQQHRCCCSAGWRRSARCRCCTLIGDVKSPFVAFVLILAALAIVSFYTSISGVVKAEMFPAEVRALGVGLSYAIANAMFGGTAEYVALSLQVVGNETWFFWYVAAMAAVALAASLWMPDTRKYGYLEGNGRMSG